MERVRAGVELLDKAQLILYTLLLRASTPPSALYSHGIVWIMPNGPGFVSRGDTRSMQVAHPSKFTADLQEMQDHI